MKQVAFNIQEKFILSTVNNLWKENIVDTAVDILKSCNITHPHDIKKYIYKNYSTKDQIKSDLINKEKYFTDLINNSLTTINLMTNKYCEAVAIYDENGCVVNTDMLVPSADNAIYRQDLNKHLNNINNEIKKIDKYIRRLNVIYYLLDKKQVKPIDIETVHPMLKYVIQSTAKKRRYKIVDEFTENAWISPDGVIYDVSNVPFPSHINSAEQFIEDSIIAKPSSNISIETYLENAGWIKISYGSLIYIDRLTEKQFNLITDLFHRNKIQRIKVFSGYLTYREFVERFLD